jgi:hypothetical protein
LLLLLNVVHKGSLLDFLLVLLQRSENDLALFWREMLFKLRLSHYKVANVAQHLLQVLIVLARREKGALGTSALR